jgi:hypothetical protein
LQLRDSLLNLFKVFGEEVRSSIIVIATKPNLKPGEAGVKRLRRIQDVMSQQGLRELVIWNGPERDETSVDDLMAAVGRAFWHEVWCSCTLRWEQQENSSLSGVKFVFHDAKGTVL